MEQEILTADNAPFKNKGSLVIALQSQGLTDTHEPAEKEGGGWVGVPKTVKTAPSKPEKAKRIKCRIHRSNVDPDNRDLPISITVNTPHNKKVFWPGQEVELTESQLGVLKDAVEEVRITIPPESGVYESRDPVALAKSYYPNMSPEIDRATGQITMLSRIPNFIIETI